MPTERFIDYLTSDKLRVHRLRCRSKESNLLIPVYQTGALTGWLDLRIIFFQLRLKTSNFSFKLLWTHKRKMLSDVYVLF